MGVRTLVTQSCTGTGEEIRSRLTEEGGFDLLPTCGTGGEALNTILNEEPDLLLVDVRLPDVSGFELIESIPSAHFPAIVLTADHPRHAARAFDVGAVDYLVRPYKQERFQVAVARVRGQLDPSHYRGLRGCLLELLEEARSRRREEGVLVVKSRGHGFTLVKTRQIDWIDAARSYVRINTCDETILARETMQSLTERLDGHRFARIHRSTLVNLARISKIVIREHGDYSIILEGGQKLNLGRSYRKRLLKLLGKPLESLTG